MSKYVEVGWGHHRGSRQAQEMQLETRPRSREVLHPLRLRALLELEYVWCPGAGRAQAGEEIGMEGTGLGKVYIRLLGLHD